MTAVNGVYVRVYMRWFVRACKIIDTENHFRNLHLTEQVSVLGNTSTRLQKTPSLLTSRHHIPWWNAMLIVALRCGVFNHVFFLFIII